MENIRDAGKRTNSGLSSMGYVTNTSNP